MKKKEMLNYDKYKHHICKLKDFDKRLEDMGISLLDDDMVLWVYLQSFPDDDILTGLYIFNFGIINEEMRKYIGQVIDYGCYKQTIVKMNFLEFKKLYDEQSKERDLLYLQYPGLILNVDNPHYSKTKEKKRGRKKCDDSEQIKLREEKLKKYRHEYYERVTKKKRQEKRKNGNKNM